MIRVGLVGCGRMGEMHLRLVWELKDINVVGVADTDLSRAKAFAAREGIGVAVGDLESLLERAEPDAVHIVTLLATHASLASMALRPGWPRLCGKTHGAHGSGCRLGCRSGQGRPDPDGGP